jgi:hypothetical protein
MTNRSVSPVALLVGAPASVRTLVFCNATAYLQPVSMTGTIEDSARHGPAELEAGVQGFLNSSLPIGDLRQQVGSLLVREGILGTILASTREDRAKFVDKTDQVRRSSWLPTVLSQRTFIHKGVSDPRSARCQVPDRSWRSLQRN